MKITHTLKDCNAIDKTVTIAGRIIFWRDLGGLIFSKISDFDYKVQISFNKNDFDLKELDLFVGNIISVHGITYLSKTNELTVRVLQFKLLVKNQLSLPEKWHGIQDEELMSRCGYIDLIRSERRQLILKERFMLISKIKEFLNKNNFYEVSTPILGNVASGASATPFSTYIDAMDDTLYLRIAPELNLKRYVVGGLNRVFEIGPCFRNEGKSPRHLPEFTMLEFYYAYIYMEDGIEFLKEFISYIANIENIESYSWLELIKKANIDWETEEGLNKSAEKHQINIDHCNNKQDKLDYLYKTLVLSNLNNPTIIYNYPSHPLAVSALDSRFSQSFQLIIEKMEMMKCYEELNDSEILLKNFQSQELLAEKVNGNMDYVRCDYDFVDALKYGLPPSVGFGLGVDRLLAYLINKKLNLTGVEKLSLRDTIIFPLVKRKNDTYETKTN